MSADFEAVEGQLMHSGLVVFLWLAFVAALQFLSFDMLMLALVACGLLSGWYSGSRCRRLVKRIRFILLAIFILFAWFTPGEAIMTYWPSVSPTREGMMLAVEHAGRVLVVVFCVALLLQALPPQRLVGALYALLRPFECVGFPAGKVAVRTLLVLKLVESDRPRKWQTWLSTDGDDVHEPIPVAREPLGARDALAAVLAFLIIAGLLWLSR